MKIASALILIALFCNLNPAQQGAVEREFERERRTLYVDRFAIGEDATSGFYYLVYKRRAQVRKIRSIWNGGCCNDPYAEDFYFKDGHPALYVKLSLSKRQLSAAVKGRRISLSMEERLYLKESKLNIWIENGETIPPSDPRWQEKEKNVLEEFKGQLENYQWYLDGKV
jgi:hypothetical protein